MRIITGRARTGKSTYIYDEIIRESRENPEGVCILIVPETMTLRTEKDLIDKFGGAGIINIRIFSFKRFIDSILESLGEGVLPEIDVFGKGMVLSGIFDRHSSQFKMYHRLEGQQGIILEFEKIVRELKQSRITPEDLERVIGGADRYMTRLKLEDIRLVYQEYQRAIKDRYMDQEDRLDLAEAYLENSHLVGNSKIWIDGFESLDLQKISLIRSLHRWSRGVSMSLGIDGDYLDDLESKGDMEAFRILRDTCNTLEEAFGGQLEKVALGEPIQMPPEIRALEKSLFSMSPVPYEEETERVRIISSINPYREVERVANVILELVRDRGYRYRDIKIAASDVKVYGRNIRKVFDRYGIEYYLGERKDVLASPVARNILSYLDMFCGNFRMDAVMGYLKSGLTDLGNGEINQLENWALANGVQGEGWFRKIDSREESPLETARAKLTRGLQERKARFESLLTLGEYTDFVLEHLEDQKLEDKVERKVEALMEEGLFLEASQLSQTWNSTMELVLEMALMGEGDRVSATRYRRMLESGLEEITISTIPPVIDTVEVGDIGSMSVKDPKVLFVMGANEGAMSDSSERGLLTDEDRAQLMSCGISIDSGSHFQTLRDNHILYKLFTSPREMLFVSYPLGNDRGDSLQPSLLVTSIKEIFPGAREESDMAGENQLEKLAGGDVAFAYLRDEIERYRKGEKLGDLWKNAYLWYRDNQPEMANLLREGKKSWTLMEEVNPQVVGERFGDGLSITVSKLERYAECPFKYYVENIMTPREREIQKVEFYDIGNEYHEIIQEFTHRLMEREEIPSMGQEEAEDLMKESIHKVRRQYSGRRRAFHSSSRNRYMETKIDRVLLRTARTLLFQIGSGDFRPAFTELQIGNVQKEGSAVMEPLEIEVGDTSVKLRGVIDRVDTYTDQNGRTFFAIIDYKSSKKTLDFQDLYHGLQIQLLVYLMAFQRKGGSLLDAEPQIGGVYYYGVDDPVIKGRDRDFEAEVLKSLRLEGYTLAEEGVIRAMDRNFEEGRENIIPVGVKKDGSFLARAKVLTEDEFNHILDFVEAKIQETTRSIINGRFEISPYKKTTGNACTYCDYGSICMFDPQAGDRYRTLGKTSIKPQDFKDLAREKGDGQNRELDR